MLLWLPSYDGKYCASLLDAVEEMVQDGRYDLTIEKVSLRPIERSRNIASHEAVKGKYDWLLMIDSDNPPQKNPLDLIEHGKDITGCPTPMFIHRRLKKGLDPFVWSVFTDSENEMGYEYVPFRRSGWMRVEGGVGTGCVLIRTDVLGAILGNGGVPFVYVRNAAEDLSFCRLARRMGYGVWADWSHICDHIKELSLLAVMGAEYEKRL